jgi:NAD(P)-dependent dehydrogenase (short-subunit alcohol dehydrogenase family)
MSNDTSKRIVLTGVSRGLGQAMATGFIARGHVVYGCGRSEKHLAKLRQEWPAPHRFDAVDVADDAAVAAWAKSVLAEAGQVDLLINNAALMNQPAPLWKVPAEEMAALLAVNIGGVTNVIRHFVPAMVARKSGVIVNFSSGWGRSTSPEVAPYCATKWAIEGLSQALSQELPEGMAVVALNPGIIDTDMLRVAWGSGASSYPTAAEWAERSVPYLLKLGPADNGRPVTVPSSK